MTIELPGILLAEDSPHDVELTIEALEEHQAGIARGTLPGALLENAQRASTRFLLSFFSMAMWFSPIAVPMEAITFLKPY